MGTKVIKAQRGELEPRPEDMGTAQIGAMVAARAEVQARYAIALEHPRSWETVRVRLLAECERPRWAERALYSLKIGKHVATGLSIRAAEAVQRTAGNLSVARQLVQEDGEREVWRVGAIDLETNASEFLDVIVTKVVERRELREGQKAIGARRNVAGEMVYLVPADEGALRAKRGAEQARAKRNCVLALTPADILEEMADKIRATMAQADATDPAAAAKRVSDAFAELGVEPRELEQYLDKPIRQFGAADLAELRGIYAAIRDRETTWPRVVRAAQETDEEAGTDGPDLPPPAPQAEALDALAASLPPADGEDGLPSREELMSLGAARFGEAPWGRLVGEELGPDWDDPGVDWSEADRRKIKALLS